MRNEVAVSTAGEVARHPRSSRRGPRLEGGTRRERRGRQWSFPAVDMSGYAWDCQAGGRGARSVIEDFLFPVF